MARERKKAAKAEFQSNVQSAVSDYNKSVAAAQKTLTLAEKKGTPAQIKQAQGIVKQLADIAPMIEILKRAESPTATYQGPITQSAADVINQTRAEGTYGGIPGFQPGTVYAREKDVPGFEGYSPDQYYTSNNGTGVSNTGKKYVNGQLVNDQQWTNYLNNVNADQDVMGALGLGVSSGGYDIAGNPIVGGEYDAQGNFVGAGVSAGVGSGTGASMGTGTPSTGAPISFGTGRTLAKDTFKKTLSSFFGEAETAKPWVEELYNAVSKLYLGGSSAEEAFNIALLDARNNPNLKTFTDRFKGIYALQDMKQTGKPVIVPTIAEYVASQAKMGDLLRQANLGDIATDEFTTELISKGNSVSTIANKIADVYNRIDLAPTAIKNTLNRFFPTVDKPTLARTILLGDKGVKELVDDLAKYEVLAAAEQQGIAATAERPGGLTAERAGEYARMGETFGSITPKLQRVAQATPITSKLAGISRRADIGQAGVESAVIKGTAAELEELQRLSEEEEARFRARAGRAETGLASQRRASRSAY